MNQIFLIANTVSIFIEAIIFFIPSHPYSFVIGNILHLFDLILYLSIAGHQQQFMICFLMRKYKLYKGGFLVPIVTSMIWYSLYFSQQKLSTMILCCLGFIFGVCSEDCVLFLLFLVWINLV